jgi:predicted acyltransferase (DUF342 family)
MAMAEKQLPTLSEENTRFGFTGETAEVDGRTLYRIVALCDFNIPSTLSSSSMGTNEIIVKASTLGGFIEKENNLDFNSNAWIFGNAKVYGDAKIYGNAKVYGDAWVYDNAKVCGDAKVYGKAWVFNNAKVYGNAEVYDNAWVYNNARVYGNAKICGNAGVFGETWVSGDVEVSEGYIDLAYGFESSEQVQIWLNKRKSVIEELDKIADAKKLRQ